MKTLYESLYRDMQADIGRCMGLELPEKENTESCFWIASNYWEKLKQLQGSDFKDESEEIDFFKNVKPKFTSWIEYFVLLSEALMFIPVEQRSARYYWENEMNRFKRFCRRNEEFVNYYESGSKYNDSVYFLRQGSDLPVIKITTPTYDVDAEFLTLYDPLVRSYLAQKRFYDYCRDKVSSLVL